MRRFIFSAKLTHLKIAPFSHPLHGADEHDGENEHQCHARRVGHAPNHAEESRARREEPVRDPVGLVGVVGRVEVGQGDVVPAKEAHWIGDGVLTYI